MRSVFTPRFHFFKNTFNIVLYIVLFSGNCFDSVDVFRNCGKLVSVKIRKQRGKTRLYGPRINHVRVVYAGR